MLDKMGGMPERRGEDFVDGDEVDRPTRHPPNLLIDPAPAACIQNLTHSLPLLDEVQKFNLKPQMTAAAAGTADTDHTACRLTALVQHKHPPSASHLTDPDDPGP